MSLHSHSRAHAAAVLLLTMCACSALHRHKPLSPRQVLHLRRHAVLVGADFHKLDIHPKDGYARVPSPFRVPGGLLVSVPLKIRWSRGHCLPPQFIANLNGRRLHTMLATGRPDSITDYATALALRLPRLLSPLPDGIGQPLLLRRDLRPLSDPGREPYLALAGTLRIGTLHLYHLPLGIIDDTAGLRAAGDYRAGGVHLILGTDFSAAFTFVTLDPGRRRLILSSGAPYQPDPLRLAAALPLTHSNLLYVTPGILDNTREIPVVLETAGDFGMLLLSNRETSPGNEGGTTRPHAGHTLDLGGFLLHTETLPRRPSPFIDSQDLLFVGAHLLNAYRITFDYSASRVYLEKR